MDYPGKVITKTQVTPTQTSASGNWTLDDQAAAIKNNNWPVALVPNPISKSLRFNSADSTYLNRTPASAGNRRTFTMNYWLKRAELGTRQVLASAGTGANAGHAIELQADNTLTIYANNTGAAITVTTTQVFRDPSAYGMLTIAFDTTQATAANRVKVYWNGTQITAFSTATYPSQNADLEFNNNVPHNIGRREISTTFYCGLYLTETNWVDGQQLTPSSFGMTNPQTGQWIPLKYSGTYGTNGFYLNFKDATSTTTLGLDYSGNANNWTTNNFSVTAGAGNDSLTDVPTPWIAYNTTGDVGGVVRGNYPTLNPLASNGTLSNGNLDGTTGSGGSTLSSTIAMKTGKWYFEAVMTARTSAGAFVGIVRSETLTPAGAMFEDGNFGYGYYTGNGNIYYGSSAANVAYGSTWDTGDNIGCAFDADAGTLVFYKNGVSQGTYSSVTVGNNYLFGVCEGQAAATATFTVNFGQRPFAYTPPTGFRSLCTTNLPATAIGFGLTNQADDYFNALLYNGSATSQNITGVGFSPDLVWIKTRSNAESHQLVDQVRGATKAIMSNETSAETTWTNGLSAFLSDGFTLPGGNNRYSDTGYTYVAWNWNAGGSNATNTSGTITSTVRANTTAKFSIVTYTGNATSGATVGHGLGVAPNLIIVRNRTASAQNWQVYSSVLGATKRLFLDLTDAENTFSGAWNNTAPTSTVFSLGNATDVNGNTNNFVAYCFAAVPGYSAFGSYTGNGSSDGPFAYLGFRPRYVLIKGSSFVSNWFVIDTSRSPYNVSLDALRPNLSGAEVNSPTTTYSIDILSNGFKLRTSAADSNTNAATFIYACFAESPFQFSNAR